MDVINQIGEVPLLDNMVIKQSGVCSECGIRKDAQDAPKFKTAFKCVLCKRKYNREYMRRYYDFNATRLQNYYKERYAIPENRETMINNAKRKYMKKKSLEVFGIDIVANSEANQQAPS